MAGRFSHKNLYCYSATLLSLLLLLGCCSRSRCGAQDVCLLYRLSSPFDKSKNV